MVGCMLVKVDTVMNMSVLRSRQDCRPCKQRYRCWWVPARDLLLRKGPIVC